ncbi:unnamed protein product [Musa acuminata subsp. burmannicoides]
MALLQPELVVLFRLHLRLPNLDGCQLQNEHPNR